MDSPPDESPVSVPEMTAAIARGDEDAFTRFHHLYWNRLYAYLMVLTKGNETHAADLAQTTMVRAAGRLPPMDSERALWAWLTRVARNALIDARRTGERRPQTVQWSDGIPAAEIITGDTLDEAALLSALEDALLELPSEERALIEETYFKGRKQADVAVERGLSLKALESRLTRLRRKLRQTLLSSLQNE